MLSAAEHNPASWMKNQIGGDFAVPLSCANKESGLGGASDSLAAYSRLSYKQQSAES